MKDSGLHLKAGDIVDYHSVIGEEITSRGHTVKSVQHMNSDPESRIVAWITDKVGCVALEALSRSTSDRIVHSSDIDPYLKHLHMAVLEMTAYTDLSGELSALLLAAIQKVGKVYL